MVEQSRPDDGTERREPATLSGSMSDRGVTERADLLVSTPIDEPVASGEPAASRFHYGRDASPLAAAPAHLLNCAFLR